jgi:hypothetical protein
VILGKPAREVAEAVGVTRETSWHWPHEHPVFAATLERRRAEIWRQPQERLRSLCSKGADSLAAAVEDGELKASHEVLRAGALDGDGTMNAISEQDPEVILRQRAAAQLQPAAVSRSALLARAGPLDTAAQRTRLAEVGAACRRTSLDERPHRELRPHEATRGCSEPRRARR